MISDEFLEKCDQFLISNELDFDLDVGEDHAVLIDDEGRELEIDFDLNKKDYGRKALQGGQEILLKAIAGEKKLKNVLDLTAGLGIDAVFLSQNGFRVTAVERNPILYLLLATALERARRTDLGELRFINSDSKKFLESLTENTVYECAYFDPMYPEKRKSALPRKEMQIFRKLVGDDVDGNQVLELALKKKFQRVVVKRPLKAEELFPGVVHSFKGTTVRYDLYIPRA